jgi:hypothetical protein
MSNVIIFDRMQQRFGTTENLAAVNDVPLKGEIYVEFGDEIKIKIGDGVTHYNDLEYFGGSGAAVHVGDTPPDAPESGQGWVHSTEGVFYTYYDDGSSQQWVEFGPVMPQYVLPKWAEGTAFPSGPANNDKFYRTDLNLLCYYDGTRWLTTQLFSSELSMSNDAGTFTANTNGTISVHQSGVYVESVAWTARVSGTNDASNYWTLAVSYHDGVNNILLASFSTQGLSFASPNLYRLLSASVGVVAAALKFTSVFSKVGSPGALYWPLKINYRLIVT